jgi:hypothetical protein
MTMRTLLRLTCAVAIAVAGTQAHACVYRKPYPS